MDIGSQQRVIIVELDEVTTEEPIRLVEAEVVTPGDMESAVTWPLPLDLETVS